MKVEGAIDCEEKSAWDRASHSKFWRKNAIRQGGPGRPHDAYVNKYTLKLWYVFMQNSCWHIPEIAEKNDKYLQYGHVCTSNHEKYILRKVLSMQKCHQTWLMQQLVRTTLFPFLLSPSRQRPNSKSNYRYFQNSAFLIIHDHPEILFEIKHH
jgi:hypothetical protein